MAADGAGGGDRAAALTLMCTKPMQVAAYVCAGTVGVKKRGADGGDDGDRGDRDDRAAAVSSSPPSSPATAHYALAETIAGAVLYLRRDPALAPAAPMLPSPSP